MCIIQRNNKKRKLSGLGIDIGSENFIVLSNGKIFKNICKDNYFDKLNKQIIDLSKNIIANRFKIEKINMLKEKLAIRYIKNIISYIATLNIDFVTIESFGAVSKTKNNGNQFLVDAKPFIFLDHLETLCELKNIELRKVDVYYPSSKRCCVCGEMACHFNLHTRIYKCKRCNNIVDRDINSAINLQKAKLFTIIVHTI